MTAKPELTTQLRAQVLTLENDLRTRLEALPDIRMRWRGEYDAAVTRSRTVAAWETWREEQITQVAVAWVLTTVFVRFCEDNRLVSRIWFTAPDGRRQQALDAQEAFLRGKASQGLDVTDRDWILDAVGHLRGLPATANLVDATSPLWLLSPSGDAATALIDFWRARDDDGALLRDLTDPEWDTRFLGDLYQDLSEAAKKKYALLQTPVFVEEFILDRTLEPALAERPLDGFKAIDPTCGSGHFLLGLFARLLDRWHAAAPGMDERARVQRALDSVYGVDLNPFAVAIARFRLTLAALKAGGGTSLEDAPAFNYHLAVGDSLLFGNMRTLFGDADIHDFAYTTEDRDTLESILADGQYDVVVGNPPYITVSDAALSTEYRQRYASCKGKYALTAPFMERFFGLAKREPNAGWVGQITSNSFMKREFGTRLVEEFLPRMDLRLVVNSEGAWIPGHNTDGTPTAILIGRNSPPASHLVRAVLSNGKRETRRVGTYGRGPYWLSLVAEVDNPGFTNEWITVTELERAYLAKHPWSLSGGGAIELLEAINGAGVGSLGAYAYRVGVFGIAGANDAMIVTASAASNRSLEPHATGNLVVGDEVRDYTIDKLGRVWFPYGVRHDLLDIDSLPAWSRYLWPSRTILGNRATFDRGTYFAEGRPWYEWHQLPKDQGASASTITFCLVATHNHFVMDRENDVFNHSAPIIKLNRHATDEDHVHVLGVLNSSLALFWMKQNSQPKGGAADLSWARTYEFTGTTLQDFPLPARQSIEFARKLEALASRAALSSPEAAVENGARTRADLDSRRITNEARVSQMVFEQEELDWFTYRQYALIDDDLTYPHDQQVALGQRAFEIVLARKAAAGEVDTAWFTRHGSTPITEIPAEWPEDYRALVQRRIDVIGSNLFIGLLERPEYKRRWAAEPWEVREKRALAGWLLDRLEDRKFWFDNVGRPAVKSVQLLADEVGRDDELVSVLRLWDGRQDIPVVTMLTTLLEDQAVPFLAAYRYRDTGLRKRAAWERTWDLQRREDAGKALATPIPVPPKYAAADFVKQSYWSHRGKLDVPKERFILYPGAGRGTDPTPLLGWAGWDHAQQSLALATLIGQRSADGWDEERLVPLVAGLAELLPWVAQWHDEFDAFYSSSPAQFFTEQVSQWAGTVRKTVEELAAWRPAAATWGHRRSRT